MSTSDGSRRQALIDLLALPDAPDLRRGHHRTVDGLPDRFTMVGMLAARFIQQHLLEQEERAAAYRVVGSDRSVIGRDHRHPAA